MLIYAIMTLLYHYVNKVSGLNLCPNGKLMHSTLSHPPWITVNSEISHNHGKYKKEPWSRKITDPQIRTESHVLASLECKKYTTYFVCMHVCTDYSGRAVWGMNCLRLLGSWDRGFEFQSRHGCLCVRLFCVCVALCVGSGLATDWSPVPQTVYRIKKLQKRPRPNKRL
jgi:hypothetical protein